MNKEAGITRIHLTPEKREWLRKVMEDRERTALIREARKTVLK